MKTLTLLQEGHLFSAQKKCLSDINTLPIRNDTLKLRNTKNDMENKLNEIEEAIKIFSKPKVFVKVD